MSDGMSDGAGVGGLEQRVREAAYELRDAILAAKDGHRGLVPAIQEVVEPILMEAGYSFTPHWGQTL